jgi:hypothetical protein
MGTQLITEKFEPAIKALEMLCNEIAKENNGAALSHLTNEIMHILNRTSRELDASKQVNFNGEHDEFRN